MPRRPGDISPISQSISGVSTIGTSSGITSTPQTAVVLNDVRPTYLKGARSRIGSRLWIYPTAYTHYSRKINQTGFSLYRIKNASGGYSSRGETAPSINNVISAYAGYGFQTMDAALKYNVTSAAQVEALNDIADEKAGIGEDLATYLQTVHLFKSKAKLLQTALDAAKKGKFKKYLSKSSKEIAKNGDKVLAASYLEYVYGWKPLVHDVYGLYELLKMYSSGQSPVIVKGHGSMTMNTDSVFASVNTKSAGWSSTMSIDFKYKGTCDIYARVDPNYIVFRILNQLGLLNPAAIAWAATPWSFVVDWLIPIGPLLSAFTAPAGLNFISGTTATRASRSYQGEYHNYVGTSSSVVVDDIPCLFTAADEGYARTVLSTWPFPTPYLNLNPLSGDRSFKALALAIQRLRR